MAAGGGAQAAQRRLCPRPAQPHYRLKGQRQAPAAGPRRPTGPGPAGELHHPNRAVCGGHELHPAAGADAAADRRGSPGQPVGGAGGDRPAAGGGAGCHSLPAGWGNRADRPRDFPHCGGKPGGKRGPLCAKAGGDHPGFGARLPAPLRCGRRPRLSPRAAEKRAQALWKAGRKCSPFRYGAVQQQSPLPEARRKPPIGEPGRSGCHRVLSNKTGILRIS